MEIESPRILAIYGSPRRKGNTATLLARAIEGARAAGAEVDELVLRDLDMSPCLEIYGCKRDGRCVIDDDFQRVHDQLVACDGIMLASPIFFYTVSAHTKILMDRCQSLWVKRHWIDQVPFGAKEFGKKGLFISVGATGGKRLFEGTLLTVRYFFEALDTSLWRTVLCRRLDEADAVQAHPDYLEEARRAGHDLASTLIAS